MKLKLKLKLKPTDLHFPVAVEKVLRGIHSRAFLLPITSRPALLQDTLPACVPVKPIGFTYQRKRGEDSAAFERLAVLVPREVYDVLGHPGLSPFFFEPVFVPPPSLFNDRADGAPKNVVRRGPLQCSHRGFQCSVSVSKGVLRHFWSRATETGTDETETDETETYL